MKRDVGEFKQTLIKRPNPLASECLADKGFGEDHSLTPRLGHWLFRPEVEAISPIVYESIASDYVRRVPPAIRRSVIIRPSTAVRKVQCAVPEGMEAELGIDAHVAAREIRRAKVRDSIPPSGIRRR